MLNRAKRNEVTNVTEVYDDDPLPFEFDYEGIELKVIATRDLVPSPVQPEGRTDEGRLRELRRQMERERFQVPLIVVPKGRNQNRPLWEILDGHRRYTAAMSLGATQLLCLVVPTRGPAHRAALFHLLNGPTRPMNGNNRINSWSRMPESYDTLVLDSMSRTQRDQIEGLVEMFGRDQVQEWSLEDAKAPLASLARNVKLVKRWCSNHDLKTPDDFSIASWILKHKMSRHIDSISRNAKYRDVKAVLNCIRNDRKPTTKK